MSVFLLNEPTPFVEALKHFLAKLTQPSAMTTAEWREIDADIRRQAFFSAQTELEALLQKYRVIIESIANPTTGMSKDRESKINPSGFVTSGYDPASARLEIKKFLNTSGFQPEEGIRGTLLDLSSDARIDLVIKTNVQLAHGAGRFVQQNQDQDVVDAWPALELMRFEERKEPRDWPHRWMLACQVAGDAVSAGILGGTGRMVALKSSDVWQQLGDGAGGFDDTLGNPYPPFAFASGMWTVELDRREAEELGLLQAGEKAEPAGFDLSKLFSTPEESAA